MQNYQYPNIKSQNDERYTNCRKTGYSILFIRNVLVVISLSFATSCSALWVFFTPFGRGKAYTNAFILFLLCS